MQSWNNLLVLADLLQVPAFHIDIDHSPSDILDVLAVQQPDFTPGATAPWLSSTIEFPGGSPEQPAIVGPVFYFDGVAGDIEGGFNLAVGLAAGAVAIRRQHVYGLGLEACWPTRHDYDLYGTVVNCQHPPIVRRMVDMAAGPEVPNWFVTVLLPSWSALQLQADDYVRLFGEGYDVLLAQEAAFPGLTRHIFPPHALPTSLFVFPWSIL